MYLQSPPLSIFLNSAVDAFLYFLQTETLLKQLLFVGVQVQLNVINNEPMYKLPDTTFQTNVYK